jgi:hypothetical protein
MSASERAAAAEAAKFLNELEAARVLAKTVPPEQVTKTFAQTVRDWLGTPL